MGSSTKLDKLLSTTHLPLRILLLVQLALCLIKHLELSIGRSLAHLDVPTMMYTELLSVLILAKMRFQS